MLLHCMWFQFEYLQDVPMPSSAPVEVQSDNVEAMLRRTHTTEHAFAWQAEAASRAEDAAAQQAAKEVTLVIAR